MKSLSPKATSTFMRKTLSKMGFLGFFIVLASLSFVIKLGNFATDMRQVFSVAEAQQMPDDKNLKSPDKAEKEAAAKKESKGETKEIVKAETEAKPATAPVTAPDAEAKEASPAWTDAADTDFEYSDVKAEMFKDLQQKREQVEVREKSLAQREALLKAAESEIDRKYQELANVRSDIEGLLKKQSAEEEARIASLVKIYEGMKPKDAANIFNTLDSDILVDVIGRMSERKSSPIIAEMLPDRARLITILLAEQKKLPELPGDDSADEVLDEAPAAADEALPAAGTPTPAPTATPAAPAATAPPANTNG